MQSSYNVTDRFKEPTSYIGLLLFIAAQIIPAFLPPETWSHIVGTLHSALGTALFFYPENRSLVSAEQVAQALAQMLPPGYAGALQAGVIGTPGAAPVYQGPQQGSAVGQFVQGVVQNAAAAGASLLALVGLAIGLCACAGNGGQPLTQAQVQQNLDNAVYLMQAAGCAVAAAGTAAAPVVSIAADAEGQQVLQAVDAAGSIVCKLVVPPTALPAPAPANAAPATVAAVPAKAS